MRLLEHGARLGLTIVAILAGSLAVAGPANAVATPAEACGNNYHEIDSHNLGLATIHLLYNGNTDCVVTQKTAYVGRDTWVGAQVAIASYGDAVHDQGAFSYYAGPVRINAPGQCIRWGGTAGPGTTGATQVWISEPSHCG